MSATDVVASVGVALLLLAFALNQRGLLGQRSPLYLALNLVGGIAAAIAAWMADLLPFVVLNAVWAAVAAGGLAGLARRRAPAG